MRGVANAQEMAIDERTWLATSLVAQLDSVYRHKKLRYTTEDSQVLAVLRSLPILLLISGSGAQHTLLLRNLSSGFL